MPFLRIKNAYEYCTENKGRLLLIILLILLLDYVNNNINVTKAKFLLSALAYLSTISVMGYGLLITRDVINNGKHLPRINVNEIVSLGVKGVIISFIYHCIQVSILSLIAWRLHFPQFELQEFFLNIPKTIKLFKFHNTLDACLFIILCFIIVYVTSFFIEIALAVLADGGNLKDALNFGFLKKVIDKIGWINYIKGYTKIILSIVLLSYLKYGIHLSIIPNYIFDLITGLLIFIIQYRGIALAYKVVKDK